MSRQNFYLFIYLFFVCFILCNTANPFRQYRESQLIACDVNAKMAKNEVGYESPAAPALSSQKFNFVFFSEQ